MAEFKEVVAQYERMCKHYTLTVGCDYCPLHGKGCVDGRMPVYPLDKLEEYEKVVMDWAAKNPEPVYPTWAEWLHNIGVTISDQPFSAPNISVYVFQVNSKMFDPIPTNIAEKLGIQPKEG